MDDKYKKAATEAMEAVKDVPDADLKKAAFEIILREKLQVAPSIAIPAVVAPSAHANKPVTPVNNVGKQTTGLTDEELGVLFEDNEGSLILKVKPAGKDVAEQQQMLAHAVLIGQNALYGKDSVTSVFLGSIARGWNLLDTNFSRTIQAAGYIQAKGKGRGVTYSFKPGAIAKLKETMQKMARGE